MNLKKQALRIILKRMKIIKFKKLRATLFLQIGVIKMKNIIKKKSAVKKSGKRSPGFRIIFVFMLVCMFAVLTSCDDTASSEDTSPGVDNGQPVVEAGNNADAAAATPDINTLATQVIAGQWGNGQDRIDALTAAGYDASDVQSQVNAIIGNNTTNSNGDGDGSKATWHDEITEPVYEDQPVYKYGYTYEITAAPTPSPGRTFDPALTGSSGPTDFESSYAAEAAALNAALKAVQDKDCPKLEGCTYTISTPATQTGTKRVQTGTKTIRKAGWY